MGMIEIRLCWSVAGRESIVGEEIQGGLWHPKTEQAAHDLEIVSDAGNEAYGPDTHWIEEREA